MQKTKTREKPFLQPMKTAFWKKQTESCKTLGSKCFENNIMEQVKLAE